MRAQNNGGPAFPVLEGETQWLGMSLRDYFAAKVIQGICSHHDGWGLGTKDQMAKWAYLMADAMLKAREAA